jgi:hypothetical protein
VCRGRIGFYERVSWFHRIQKVKRERTDEKPAFIQGKR